MVFSAHILCYSQRRRSDFIASMIFAHSHFIFFITHLVWGGSKEIIFIANELSGEEMEKDSLLLGTIPFCEETTDEREEKKRILKTPQNKVR